MKKEQTKQMKIGGNKSHSLKAVPGAHIRRIPHNASGFIVENKKTRYSILLPENPAKAECLAADELAYFFEKATGIALRRVTRAEKGGKYLSLGGTALFENSGEELDIGTLGSSGYRVFCKDGNVFMAGASDLGTLYAAYEFLSLAFKYEVFSEKTIRIQTNLNDVPLYDYDITEVPDFQYRSPSHAYIKYNETLKNRFRMTDLEDSIKGEGGPYHNSFNYLPPKEYKEKHPAWYSDNPSGDENLSQLCYTAHGDAEEFREMVLAAAQGLQKVIIKNKQAAYIAFTHQDNFEWCECAACRAKKESSGGANSATVITFLNAVRKELQKWFGTEEGRGYDNNQKLVFFAYHGSNKPPSAGSGIKLNGVVPFFAETNGDYTCPIDSGAVNEPIAENMRGWALISDEILFWTYGTNFESYLTPYNSFAATPVTYRFAAGRGAGLIFDECQINTGASTAWEELKGYLYYKTAWNTGADLEKLTNDFFEASYGPGAAAMRAVYGDYLRLAKEQNKNGYSGSRSIFVNPLKKEYWPKDTLLSWLELMEKAYCAADGIRDAEAREITKRNIALERVSPLYLISELYADDLGAKRLAAYRAAYKADIERCGVTMFNEKKKTSVLFENWKM